MQEMNFVRDVVEAASPRAIALIELRRTGSRRSWSFGDVQTARHAQEFVGGAT
jgi:hypothetical protein